MGHNYEDHRISLPMDITNLEVKLAGAQKLPVTYIVDFCLRIFYYGVTNYKKNVNYYIPVANLVVLVWWWW